MVVENGDDIDGDAPLAPFTPLDPEVEELWSSRALLLVLLLLILSFWVSYYLKVRRIKSIHETIVALIAGGVVGLIVRLSPGTVVQSMISFKHTILLNVLLPPIILNSGFELRQANFFRNFGVILAFAFAGTFISAIVVGVLVYIWALLGLEGLSLSIVECLIFGSTLSATDPVTILAIFNTLKVDPKLYSIIFGESILNDAVAIVMFETLSQFHGEKVHILSFFHGVGIFLLIFLTSMALGVVFGLACSLMLKHSRLNEYPEIESCLIILIAYTSYFFSNGLTMSGIVSLLFCGITLKHYAYHNMSRRSQRTSKYIFASLAQLSENFIFIYLGLSLFTQEDLVYKPVFILVTAMAVVAARWTAVFPISKLINFVFRSRGARNDELPQSYQMMLFWAGLRGAVGVALAAGIKGHNAKSLRTTVLVTVVITLIVFGGTVSKMIEIVGIRTGVEEDDDSSDEEGPISGGLGGYRATGTQDMPYRDYRNDSVTSLHGSNGKRLNSFRLNSHDTYNSDDEDNEVLPSASSPSFGDAALEGESGAVWRDGEWFNVLDERYLLPVFSNATASRRQATRKAMRSTARLGHYNNDGAFDEPPERDLSSRSEPSRSPFDPNGSPSGVSPPRGSGRDSQDIQSGGFSNSNARTRSGSGGGHVPRNSRGFVQSYHHKQTPSLSVAISSLFSSLASSSAAVPNAEGGRESPPSSHSAGYEMGHRKAASSSGMARASPPTVAAGHPRPFTSSLPSVPAFPIQSTKRRHSEELSQCESFENRPSHSENVPLAGTPSAISASVATPPRYHRESMPETSTRSAALSISREESSALFRRASSIGLPGSPRHSRKESGDPSQKTKTSTD